MSSLAATQADGYYHPPEYYNSGHYKKKTRNQFRNKQSSEGSNLNSAIVRFELPYKGMCLHCGTAVGKGTRFNAKKTKAGAYLLSTIHEFQMKCRICTKSTFAIRTNPKEQSFDYVEGIKRLADTDGAASLDTVDSNRLVGSADRNSLAHIESVSDGKRKALTQRDALETLLKVNDKTSGNDVVCNSQLRSSFRQDRKAMKQRLLKAKQLGWKEGMQVLVGQDSIADVVAAKSTVYSNGRRTEERKFRALRKSSIFDKRRATSKSSKALIKLEPDQVSSAESTFAVAAPQVRVKMEPDTQRPRMLLTTAGSKMKMKEARQSSALDLLAGYGSDDSD